MSANVGPNEFRFKTLQITTFETSPHRNGYKIEIILFNVKRYYSINYYIGVMEFVSIENIESEKARARNSKIKRHALNTQNYALKNVI